jgi:hypothetical protein
VLGKAMTTRGRQTAFLFGIGLAFALPKQVPCEVPGRSCEVIIDRIARVGRSTSSPSACSSPSGCSAAICRSPTASASTVGERARGARISG